MGWLLSGADWVPNWAAITMLVACLANLADKIAEWT